MGGLCIIDGVTHPPITHPPHSPGNKMLPELPDVCVRESFLKRGVCGVCIIDGHNPSDDPAFTCCRFPQVLRICDISDWALIAHLESLSLDLTHAQVSNQPHAFFLNTKTVPKDGNAYFLFPSPMPLPSPLSRILPVYPKSHPPGVIPQLVWFGLIFFMQNTQGIYWPSSWVVGCI